jgi:hypothetical protein
MHTYVTDTGAQLLPPFALAAAASSVHVREHTLMVIAVNATLSVW